MSRVLRIVILVVAAVSVDAARDESGKVEVSVKPTSFQLASKAAESVDQLDLDEDLGETAEDQQLSLGETAEESKELSEQLGKAVNEVFANEGLTADAEKFESMENAKHSLQLLAKENQHVNQLSEYLDQRVQSKFANLLGNQLEEGSTAASTQTEAKQASESEHAMDSLDKQFADLESKKETLVQFFNELKQVKEARKQFREKKAQVVKEALNAGLSMKEVQELSGAIVAPHPTSVIQQSDSPISFGNPDNLPPPNLKGYTKEQMKVIDDAANDVLSGLDKLRKWRESADNTPAGLEKGGQLKDLLDKKMKILEEHQASEGMNMIQVGHLKDLYNTIFAKMHALERTPEH